jgi:hypothetical protein
MTKVFVQKMVMYTPHIISLILLDGFFDTIGAGG